MTTGITPKQATAGLPEHAVHQAEADAGTIPLTASDDEAATRLLARAFHTDPMMIYLAPDESARNRRTQPFFAATIRYGRHYGMTEMTSTGDAVTLWLKPGFTTLTVGRMVRTGIVLASLKLGFSGLIRLNTLASHSDKLHKQAISGDHWYLMTIGVDPDRQRMGAGGRLLSAGLQRADDDGLPCYLETTNPENLPFYRRHGFEVAADGQVPKSELHVWAMVRR